MRYQHKALTWADKPEWVSGYLVKAEGVYTNIKTFDVKEGEVYDNTYRVLPHTVCSCTGLMCSCNYIYEHDILEYSDFGIKYIVVYNGYKYELKILNYSNLTELPINWITELLTYEDIGKIKNFNDFRIVGNIYDDSTIESYIDYLKNKKGK